MKPSWIKREGEFVNRILAIVFLSVLSLPVWANECENNIKKIQVEIMANGPAGAKLVLKREDRDLSWLQSILGKENKTRTIEQKLYIWDNCSQIYTNKKLTQWGPCPSENPKQISKILGSPKAEESIILTEYYWTCNGTQSYVTAIVDQKGCILKLHGLNCDSTLTSETQGECVISEDTVFGISVYSDLEEKASKNPIIIKMNLN